MGVSGELVEEDVAPRRGPRIAKGASGYAGWDNERRVGGQEDDDERRGGGDE